MKDDREASNSVESKDQHRLIIHLDNSLLGNVLELARSIDKFLPNLVGKLDGREKVAYTEANAHRGNKYSAVIAV